VPAPVFTTGICDPSCPVCHGIGYVRQELPIKHPAFGKVQLCPNAKPRVDLERSGLNEEERSSAWGDLRVVNNIVVAVEAVQCALARGAGWVYLWGNPGLGKTNILKIAVAENLRRGIRSAYAEMSGVMDDLRSAYDEKNPGNEASSRMDYWSGLPLLCLDEFAVVGKETEWLTSKRFALMNARWNLADNRQGVTVMASKVSPETFAEDYLLSRINDGRFAVVHVEGEDVRRYKDWTV
jgi:DNA replication protein DnaC